MELPNKRDVILFLRRPRVLAVLRVFSIVFFALLILHHLYLWYVLTRLDPASLSMEEWQLFQQDYQRRFHRLPPPTMPSWLAFAKWNKCDETHFYQGIEYDLQYYRKHIDETGHRYQQADVVPKGLGRSDNCMAFHLEHHELTLVASRVFGRPMEEMKRIEHFFRWLLEPVVAHAAPTPLNATFFFHLHDAGTPPGGDDKPPMFALCRMSFFTDNQPIPIHNDDDNHHNPHHNNNIHHHHFGLFHDQEAYNPQWPGSFASADLMIPYHDALLGHVGKTQYFPTPFGQRQDALVWRGSTTGDWGEGPRFGFIEQYSNNIHNHNNSVRMDVAFSRVVQNASHHTLTPNSLIAKGMSYYEMQDYKYIMDLDGNAFSARFPELLKLGSVIFKSTRYREWYTERLRPHKDYVPVNYNLSDLVEKLEWIHRHPQQAEQMVQQAKQTVEHHIRPQDMQCYSYRLMLEYMTLFDDD